MPEPKPKIANFPEREPKVVIGPNINATVTKALTRMTIGTFEMSFTQQENGANTCQCTRSALNTLGKTMGGFTVTSEKSRDYVGMFDAKGAEHRFQLWVTTPFELTQSAHVVWVKYSELGGEGRIGIAFKFATGFTIDDLINLLKAAQRNAQKLEAGEAYVLKGNPPPRFQKKAKPAAAETPAAEAPATEAAEAAAEPPAEAPPAG